MELYNLPQNAKAGAIYLSKNLDTLKDIVVSFDYACYGNELSGSEGFCVFFFNNFAEHIDGGGPGPGLCYAQTAGISATMIDGSIKYIFDGVNSAYAGIGFDITGSFGVSGWGVDGPSDPIPNSITIRGGEESAYSSLLRTETLTSSAFKQPFSLYQCITGSEQPRYNTIRVRLTDFSQRILVDIRDPKTGRFVNYVDTFINTVAPNAVNCCLSFASGLTETCFSVRNFSVNGKFTDISQVGEISTWTYSPATVATYFSIAPVPATLTVRDTIEVVSAPPYEHIPPLILVSESGGAPLQNSDGYINVVEINNL